MYPAQAFTVITSGEVQGGTTALQLPDIPCGWVNIKAVADNAGNVYLGGVGVTVPGALTNQTAGLTLDAGQETGWMPIDNLNHLYRICDNNGDDLTYLVLR
jgi:hypothetical protein